MARMILNVIPDDMLHPTASILGDPSDPPDRAPIQIGSGDDAYACGWCDTVLTNGDDPSLTYAGVAIRCPACGRYNATGDAGIKRDPVNADKLDSQNP